MMGSKSCNSVGLSGHKLAPPAITIVFVVLAIGEIICTLALLIPWRSEHHLVLTASRVGRFIVQERVIGIPGILTIAGSSPDSVLSRTVALAQAGAISQSAALFANDATIATNLGDRSLPVTLHAQIPFWLAHAGAYTQLGDVITIKAGQNQTELAMGTTAQMRPIGVVAADALYTAVISQGKIQSLTVSFLPASAARIDDALTDRRLTHWHPFSGWLVLIPMSIVVVASTGFLFARVRRRMLIAAFILVWPVLTALVFTINDSSGSAAGRVLPAQSVYTMHATLAITLQKLGDPRDATLQWVKAASHAQSPAQYAEAAQGIVRARDQIGPSFDPTICHEYIRGSHLLYQALAQAGIHCPSPY